MPDAARPRHVIVSGASGLIGRALTESLRRDGVEVTTLVRRAPRAPHEVRWLDGRPLDPGVLAGADAVVGLNGANIGRIPWTRRYKSDLLWSRLTPTRVLARAIRALGDDAPKFVSASAVGFYGSAPRTVLTESSRPGNGFLPSLCVEWENAAREAGPRTALLRSAPIVHPDGVLKPLFLLIQAGVGGPIGAGTQSWPWISLTDEVRAIRHVIDHDLIGPVNLVGPSRATANDLGFAIALRWNRPYLLRVPVWALRTALGRDMTDSVLTNDAHVMPDALQSSGFTFRQHTVEAAVDAVL